MLLFCIGACSNLYEKTSSVPSNIETIRIVIDDSIKEYDVIELLDTVFSIFLSETNHDCLIENIDKLEILQKIERYFPLAGK